MKNDMVIRSDSLCKYCRNWLALKYKCFKNAEPEFRIRDFTTSDGGYISYELKCDLLKRNL